MTWSGVTKSNENRWSVRGVHAREGSLFQFHKYSCSELQFIFPVCQIVVRVGRGAGVGNDTVLGACLTRANRMCGSDESKEKFIETL